MEARAEHKFARISPRKVSVVCDLIRGKDVKEAEAILQNTPKAASELLIKVLKSAAANAENNFDMPFRNMWRASAIPSSANTSDTGSARRCTRRRRSRITARPATGRGS